MVNKGMNVGDVFEDGGLFYVVVKIVGSGYISHNISAEEKQAIESKQAEPEGPEAQADPETQAEPEASAEDQTKKPASRKRTNTKRGQ